MDELNMQMEDAAAGDQSTHELEAAYESQPTVVIYEGQPSASQQVADAVSTQATVGADLKSKFWTHEATLLLIELYKSYQENMKDPRIKKKDVWNRIASDMAANGFQFHGDMCDKKWRNLKKSYCSVLESKTVQGQTRRLWQYFDILNEVFPKESSNTDSASGLIATIGGGDNVDGANGSLIGLSNASGRSSTASSSKVAKSRSKASVSAAAAAAAVIPPISNTGVIAGSHVNPHDPLEVALIDGALEDMPPIQALKVLLDRQERSEERRMNRMMEELRKMHDENLEVMHERNVLLHRLIEQLSSGT